MSISATNQGLRPGVCLSTARPTTPFDGMMIYETDTNLVRIWNGTAWKTLSYSDYTSGSVLQVVSTTKTDTFTTTSATFTDVTGLSATITPSSSSSLVLVQLMMYGGNTSTGGGISGHVALLRGSTQIALGDAAGNRIRAFSSISYSADTQSLTNVGGIFLDNPATTSATTYKIQVRSAGTFTVNRTGGDVDIASQPRTISTITVMEIAG